MGVVMLLAQQATPPDNPTASNENSSAQKGSGTTKRGKHRKSTPNANPNVPTDSSAPPTAPKTPVSPPDPTKPANNATPGQPPSPGVPKPPAS